MEVIGIKINKDGRESARLRKTWSDEDEGSLPQGRTYREKWAVPAHRAGKIERSADALRASHGPSFPSH